MSSVDNIEPKEVFHWFSEISKIPRESHNEQAISDFLVDFARKRSLEVYQDDELNVIIKKPGTKGYEQSAPVILQGHMDMVCEKTADSPHDFLKDPIKLIVDGDLLHADKTTLGGDDGIAVAYTLAILDSDSIPHPPLEILITTCEETGMNGAMGLKPDHLDGKLLFNIDSEDEGIFLVSCAGGANAEATFDIETEPLKNQLLSIKIDGLTGGHSGVEIHKQRANAIKVLGRVLYTVKSEQAMNIVSINGGSKHNAIANHAEVLVAVSDSAAAQKSIEAITTAIKSEYRTTDPELRIAAAAGSSDAKTMFTTALSNNIVDFMMMVPDAVQNMSMDIEGLVQTSLNNGILTQEENAVCFTISIRSSVKSTLDEMVFVLKTCAERTGAHFSKSSEYPAWEYAAESRARETAVSVYKELTGKEPVVSAIHAGLECGLIKKIIPDVDALSFGPDIRNPHTPNEYLSISSAERVWKFLLKLLEALK